MGKGVAAVQREQQDPVDVAAGGIRDEPVMVLVSRHHREDELEAGLGDGLVGAAQHAEEERVREHPLLGLVDDERHRVALAGHE